ncbi:MAG: terminase large subunit [Candidatus Reddybacter sp.]
MTSDGWKLQEDIDTLAQIDTYCAAVQSGEKPACKWERLAVQRHLDDLASQGEYVFDEQKACRAVRFIQRLPHVKGHFAAAKGPARFIYLEPWQKFIIASIFGWINSGTRLRKYRVAYICVPRKNGKSILAAGIALYMLMADGEYGAEVYCGATTEKQAWEVFRPAREMVRRTPGIAKRFGVSVHAKRLECDTTTRARTADGSRFEPVIGKPGDGSSPSCAVLDEVHEHEDDDLYDTMLTGMGARLQGLMLLITTAGSNTAGPCYAQQKELEAVLQGTVDNPELFGIIYSIDTGDDWTTEQALIKANPNYGVSVGPDFLKARVRDAINSARKQNIVKTKHFNIWVTAKEAWLNIEDWNKQADPNLLPGDFESEDATLGIDLSTTDDLTAAVKCFRREIKGEDHYYIFGRYYCTEEKINENPHYQQWVYDGHLNQTDGARIDYGLVEEHIDQDAGSFVINECYYDRHGAEHLAQNIQADSEIEAIEVAQTYGNFSAPMRDFEGLLKAGRIHHDGNPCLTWMMGNVVAKTTLDGKMTRPVKENRASKIDGAVAALMAFLKLYSPDDDGEDSQDFVEY